MEYILNYFIVVGYEGDGISFVVVIGKVIEELLNEKEIIIFIELFCLSCFIERVLNR